MQVCTEMLSADPTVLEGGSIASPDMYMLP